MPHVPRDGPDADDPFGSTDKALIDPDPPSGADRPARVYLVVTEPGRRDLVELEPQGELILGRAPDAGIQVQGKAVSRHHTRIWRHGDALYAEDRGSRNGTRVNGRILSTGSHALFGGDVVALGPAVITVAVAHAPSGIAPVADEAVEAPDGMIVADSSMREVYGFVARLARSDATVLVLGETGVGKEVVAEAIHRQSDRVAGPFVRLNCAALTESLLEAELFGHEKGAFTGAARRRTGFVEAADKGTLFLDEIGELPLSTQVKLLRVVENRTIVRLGATADISVDVRFICATHRDLEVDVKSGRFREDLYYRISAFTVRVPPLRERQVEVPLLAEQFLRKLSGGRVAQLDPGAIAALCRYPWPGNVRELRNAMEHALVLTDTGRIRASHLPEKIVGPLALRPATEEHDAGLPHQRELLERDHIEKALSAESGNQTRAAVRLGISRRTLIYKLRKYGLR